MRVIVLQVMERNGYLVVLIIEINITFTMRRAYI